MKKSVKKQLTVKQQKFADLWISGVSGTQAYIDAGYSVKNRITAESNAKRLLRNDSVKAYIDERMVEIASKRIADQTEICEFLTAVMRGEVTEPAILPEGVIKELKPNVNARRQAAVDLGRRYGMWTDRKEIEVDAAIVVSGEGAMDG